MLEYNKTTRSRRRRMKKWGLVLKVAGEVTSDQE